MTTKELELIEESMSQEEIMAYAKKIKPIMRGLSMDRLNPWPVPNAKPYWLEPIKIATQTFFLDGGVAVKEAVGLQEVARIRTYHCCGYPLFLKPSINECIYQCPKEILDKVCAFEVYSDSESVHSVYDKELDRHVLITIFYTGTLPEDIATQPVEW